MTFPPCAIWLGAAGTIFGYEPHDHPNHLPHHPQASALRVFTLHPHIKGVTDMRPRSDLTINDLALAYELRQEGCCWKRIAEGLGCTDKQLHSAIHYVTHYGIHHRAQEAA